MTPTAGRTGDRASATWTSPAIMLWPLGPADALARQARLLVDAAQRTLPVGAERLADVLLMVQELASNAAEHGAPPYELRIYHAPETTTVELLDAGERYPVMPRHPAPELTFDDVDTIDLAVLERGRGLVTVAALSGGRCGVRLLPGRPGKAIWFAVPRDG